MYGSARRRGAIGFLLVLALCLAFPEQSLAQSPRGRLVGTVLDSQGGVLPGATVTLTNEDTNHTDNAVTDPRGVFTFNQLAVGSYRVKIELANFRPALYNRVAISPGQEYSLTTRLVVGATEVLEVTAGQDLVHTTTPEISQTVVQKQILDLPLNARNVIELIRLQAGVPGIVNRTNTAINGGRPTWTQVTQDGINIQDNFIRTNSLDFVPNRPSADAVGEFTITTSTQGADASGGSSQVRLVTPSGSNEFHGAVWEYNRNSRFGANSWFNNASKVPKSYLNRNQFGGRLGGPIMRDKLFFFGYYEGYRQKSDVSQNLTVPVRNDLLSGAFRWVRPDGTVGSVNVLNLVGLTVDPVMQQRVLGRLPSSSLVNNFDAGNSRADRLLNTAGYRFLQRDYNDRDSFGLRMDYQPSPNHHFEGTYTHFVESDGRTDIDGFNPKPLAFTESSTRLMVGAWNWVISSRMHNELRGGANLAPVDFKSDEDWGGMLFAAPALGMNNPIINFQPQGRDTRTFQFSDRLSLILGGHAMEFGASLQQVRVRPYNFAGRFPTVNFGFSASAPTSLQLSTGSFPGGISAADLANANALLTYLAGIYTSLNRSFEVSDKSSGFVPGIPNERNFSLDNWAVYAQDSWRMAPNFTLRGGIKWEYFSPLREDNDLALLPVLNGRSLQDVMLDPNGTVSFVDGDFYGKDLNNFGPTIGFAWDPFKNGRTSVRGGYTMSFINEETIRVGDNAVGSNSGLATTVSLTNQFGRVSAGVPTIPTPTFQPVRSYRDQLALSPTAVVYGIEPDIKQPVVHQFSIGVERELPGHIAIEARYVANLGRGLFRGIDLNQINAGAGGAFLQDFLRARQNGFLAQARTGVFDPAYNPAVPGSAPLTVIPNFGGGFLTNATVRNNIQTGAVAALADFYITQRVAGANAAFLRNPSVYAVDLVLNGGRTDYHGLQLELRRQFRSGLFGQINYTLSRATSDSFGDGQARFEPYLDNARPELNEARSPFDVMHVINANMIVELPFGEGKRFLNSNNLASKVFGGWQVGAIMHWQSGSPLSFTSGRGTFNRGGRSGANTAITNLSPSELRKLLGVRKLPDGRVYWIDPAVIDPGTGRAAGVDNLNNSATFPGQIFSHPTAGNVGSLELLAFDGPSQFLLDMSLIKRIKLARTSTAQLRVDAFNVLNHPNFDAGDFNINSATFGRITGTNTAARVIQFAVRLEF